MLGSVHTTGVLFLLAAIICVGQSPVKPVFPNDGENPRKVDAAAMLQAVCPGDVVESERLGCHICPGEEVAPNGENTLANQLVSVIRGHFVSATSDDAVLWTSGCAVGTSDPGWTYLVSRRSGKWELVDKTGSNTSLCHKVRRDDGRDTLICLWEHDWWAGVDYHLTFLDFESGSEDIYTITDSSQSCGEFPEGTFKSVDPSKPFSWGRTYISGVGFETKRGRLVALLVIVNRGQKTFQPGQVCSPELIPTRPSRLRFSWTGTKFERVG